MKNKPIIIGLTGGIGAGKTQATQILRQLGAYVVDADDISRELTQKGNKGYVALKREFPTFFDEHENLDKKKLREFVFQNKLTQRLNHIMFPIIIEKIENCIRTSAQDIVFLVAPLLVESGMNEICDKIILVSADREKRIERISARDNIDRKLAEAMIASQASDDERARVSDIIICNNNGVEELFFKVKQHYEKIRKEMETIN